MDHMMLAVEWLKHAFAVDPPGPAVPNEDQRVLVDKLCAEVVRRRLTAPALLMLEMSRPLNYVSAQLLHFFQPLVAIVTDADGYLQLTKFLEQRGSIDYLCQHLEALEAQSAAKERVADPSRPVDGDQPAVERHGER